jgi:hypothetical protein
MKAEKSAVNQAGSDAELAVSIREMLSAWMDGKLSARARSLWYQVNNNAELRDDFCCYFLIRVVNNRYRSPDLWAKIRPWLDA